MEQFFTALLQIGIFLLLICIGIITVKARILDGRSLAAVSKLVIEVSLPAYIFINAVESTARESLMQSLIIIPVAVCMYMVLIGSSFLTEKLFHLKGDRKGVYRASMVFGNIGFMGIPLVTVIYPDNALIYVSVFTIVDQLLFWTYGVRLVKKPEKSGAAFRNLISPPLIAILLAIAFIIAGVHVPKLFASALRAVGSTSIPLALIYIGGVLCTSNLRPVLRCGELYTGIIVKMTVIPVIFYIVMTFSGLPADMAGALAFLTALPGIEMVPMLAKEGGSEGDYAVCTIMLTTVCSLITLPVVSLLITLVSRSMM